MEPVVEPAQLFGKQLVRKLLLPVVLAVLAYSALLLYGDSKAVGAAARLVPASAILFGLTLSLVSFALRAVRWQYYLRLSGIVVPFGSSILIFLSGLAMSITPGKVGEILKSLLLKEGWDVPVARSAPIVVAERVMDLAALLMLGGAGFVAPKSPALATAVVVVGTLGFLAIGKSQRLALVLIGLLTKIPPVARYREKLLTAHASLFELWGTGPFFTALGLSIAAWASQALILVVFGAGMPPAGIGVADSLVAYSAPLLAGTLALLPGGLVLTEASMAGTLQGLSGVSAAAAATLTILVRGATFWLAVALGFIAIAIWRSRKPNDGRLAPE
jgi:glycosyltransferase 2 family protein